MEHNNYITFDRKYFALTDSQFKHLLETIVKKGHVWTGKNYPFERSIKWKVLSRIPSMSAAKFIWDLNTLDKKTAEYIIKNKVK